MPKYSVLVEYEIIADGPDTARNAALNMAQVGLEFIEGGETCRLHAGDGDLVNLDELSKQAELIPE